MHVVLEKVYPFIDNMPPKRNRQTPKNAFFHFMMEFKDRQGRQYNSLKEVADAAGPHWSKMSRDQKRPYEERALMEKNSMRAVKLTSDGQDVEELERQERFVQERIQEMKDDINYNLKMASDTGRIQDELFFIIHVNTFCYCTALNRYYPAEIAIVCFSLEDGVLPQNVFHRIIKPGELPLGYASDAKLQSEETHQLPPPLAGEYENNIDEVYTEMKLFLSTKLSGSKRFPPLYADEKMLKMTQHILNTWCQDFEEDRPLFKVYNLQFMFKVLRNLVANDNVWPNDTYSSREIEKDLYAYANGISCEFHAVTEVCVHCSRSIVIRYAYTICDNCCADLRIMLVPGTHIPDQALTPYTGSRSSSRASLVSGSSKSSRMKQSIRDDDSDSVMSFSSKSQWDNQSVISDSSNLSLDNDFPEFGVFKKKSSFTNSEPQFTSVDSRASSIASSRSYAGVMGTSGLSRRPADVPSSVSKEFGALSISDSGNELPMGRGRSPSSFSTDLNQFPSLGGRGKVLGRGRRMN